MYACRVENGNVIREPARAVIESGWKKLVNARKLGSTVVDSTRYVVAGFETKSGTEKDAINTPAGAWLLDEFEARSFAI